MSTSADNDIISKDKKVSDLEEEVRKKLGPINLNDFLRQIYPEEKPMRTEDRIFSYFNETPDDEDREILQASKAPFSIEFVEEALDEKSEEYQTLRKGVKKVLGIIVGSLEDRACVEDKSDRKRARIEGVNRLTPPITTDSTLIGIFLRISDLLARIDKGGIIAG
ncbi:hypothetical protein RhiirA5_429427 [Rhizophagus irregularis]|uniref:Uncharacterized protein n=1 Tax=Rhizophagus irregularis TaxID=588596 RepID=A0A2N0NYG7_9GLOM|nr:hypothetical protein RhiirA5_429427 [Rhizophagus irregularis]